MGERQDCGPTSADYAWSSAIDAKREAEESFAKAQKALDEANYAHGRIYSLVEHVNSLEARIAALEAMHQVRRK